MVRNKLHGFKKKSQNTAYENFQKLNFERIFGPFLFILDQKMVYDKKF